VVNQTSDDLKVIDVSNPASPSTVGTLAIGPTPRSVYVSGRYAYVVDTASDDLKVVDVSNPASPSTVGTLAIGTFPRSVYVSGRYAYVVNQTSNDLRVIDVSNPASPSTVGTLALGGAPVSLYVSGRYAYVVDQTSDDLKVIDISGIETTSLIAHSLEAGNLQVRNDIIAQGQLQVTGGVNIGSGGLYSQGPSSFYASSTASALTITQRNTGDILNLFDGTTEVFTVLDGGNVGIGTATPNALLHIGPGTTTTAPFQLTDGSLLQTLANGTLEYESSTNKLYFTAGGYRDKLNKRIASTIGVESVKTWTARSASEANSWNSVTWSPELGLFVAVSSSGTNQVMTSPDGITWTARAAAEASWWQSVTWSPDLGLFVAVAVGGAGQQVMTSPDGITWTARVAPNTNRWYSVIWSPELGLFAAVARDSTSQQVMTSSDGITWTERSAAEANYWTSVTWSPELGIFAAVSNDGTNRVMTSPDGITWTAHSPALVDQWRSVIWSPELGIFAAVSANGRVITSPDGTIWTERSEPTTNFWLSVTWSPELGLFVAVSASGTNRVMTSPDGITWTARAASEENNWNSVIWSPELGIFAAVSSNGTNRIMTSKPPSSKSHVAILSAGLVGIGTASPASRLHVLVDDANTSSIVNLLTLDHTVTATSSAGIGTGVLFRAENASGATVDTAQIASSLTDATSGSEDGILAFFTAGPNSTALSERMRIDSAGNIGIGTTSPTERLTVVGNIANLANTAFSPSTVGTLALGTNPLSVYVSGRYAYVLDQGSTDLLKIIDVSNPASPSTGGTLALGALPRSVYVSGRYAYVVDQGSNDLKVIDVSNPASPSTVGTLALADDPFSVYVSGRYAYVVDFNSDDLKIIDVSNPASPATVGTLALGTTPQSVYVSGRYAYVVDQGSDDLKIIDVSNPASPSTVGTLAIGSSPKSVYVSGRYAYVVDQGSDDLKIIDVSNPASPATVGTLALGTDPFSVYVSGRYAYVVDRDSDDLKVIDVSNPASPATVGTLAIGASPQSVYVSGRYAYVVDLGSQDLKIIDISGIETTSLIAHSLEAGNLQVRNDIIAQGQLQITGGVNIGSGGLYSQGPSSFYASSTASALTITQRNTGDILNLFDGTTEVFTVLDGGLVGIGDTSPDFGLEITASSTTGYFAVSNGAAGDGDLFTIDEVGNVGIGITPIAGVKLLLPQENDAATPTLSFGDGDTGFYESSDDQFFMATAGVARAGLNTLGFLDAVHGDGPQMVFEATTATNPVFIPHRSDFDTGLGVAALDQLSLIAGGVEMLRLVESTTDYIYTTAGNFGIGDSTPNFLLELSETGLFGIGDINDDIIDDMESTLNWISSDTANTATSTESSIVKTELASLKITTVTASSNTDTVRKTFSSNQNYSDNDRIGFWIRADTTTTSVEGVQAISIQFNDTVGLLEDHNITILGDNTWQYEEWDISGIASADRDVVDFIQFVIDDDSAAPTFYIDQLREYDKDNRSAEIYVDGQGRLQLAAEQGFDFTTNIASNKPSLTITSAVVELNQPLSVNVGGDVGIDYDLQFLNTGVASITSEGPLQILAGDANHAENLTLGTQGTGDVVIDIVNSNPVFGGFKVLGVQGGSVFRVLPSGDLEVNSILSNFNTPYGGFGRYENFLTYSEEFDNAVWSTSGVSVSANSIAAPDGRTTADSIVDDSTAGGNITQDVTATGTETWTFSVWLRGASSQAVVIELSDNGTTSASSSNSFTIDEVWSRYYVTHTTAAGTATATVRINHTTTASSDTIYAWGAQAEKQSDAGVYAFTIGSTASSTARGFTSRSVSFGPQQTLTANATTTSVVAGSHFLTANTATTTYSNFLDGAHGQILVIEINDTFSGFDCTSSNLNCGTDISADSTAAGDIFTFIYDGTNWNLINWMDASTTQTGADIAELFPSTEDLEPGDLVALDTVEPVHVRRTTESYESQLVGIVSTDPGITLGDVSSPNQDGVFPIALVGRVPLKVSQENGPISIGDPLTSSSEPGVGMKATAPGRIIGFALEPFDEITGAQATTVEIFLNPHWSMGLPDENGMFGTSSGQGSPLWDEFVANVGQALAQLTGTVQTAGSWIFDQISVKTARIEKLELVDQKTGQVYCTWISNGEWVKVAAECDKIEYLNGQVIIVGQDPPPPDSTPSIDSGQASSPQAGSGQESPPSEEPSSTEPPEEGGVPEDSPTDVTSEPVDGIQPIEPTPEEPPPPPDISPTDTTSPSQDGVQFDLSEEEPPLPSEDTSPTDTTSPSLDGIQ